MADAPVAPSKLDAIPCKELCKVHPDYDADGMIERSDFYHGGQQFERRKDKYLLRRESDSIPGTKTREVRLSVAAYLNEVGSIVDDNVAATFQAQPYLEVEPDAKASGADYWRNLNEDADGRGTDFCALVKERAQQAVVQFRSYIALQFPQGDAGDGTLDSQKTRGALDAYWCGLDAKDVDDWERDDTGNLTMVRTHRVDYLRTYPSGPRTIARHTWTYIDANCTREYVAERHVDKDGGPWGDELAYGTETPHEFGALPVIEIRIPKELWMMDKMLAGAKALFNADCSRAYAVHMGALTHPVLKSDNFNQAHMVLTESAVTRIGEKDSFSWESPKQEVFAALQAECDYLRAGLRSTPHSIAKNLPGQQENARQSGSAKQQDKGPMSNLLRSLAEPIRDAIERAIRLLKKFRKDEFKVTLRGLDKFDIQADEMEINKTSAFIQIEGMPPTAKRIALEYLIDTYLGELDEKDAVAIKRELKGDGGEDISTLTDNIGKIPLALQQLALARQRFIETGDTVRAERMARHMDALLNEMDLAGVLPAPKTATPKPPAVITSPKTGGPAGFDTGQVAQSYTK